MIMGDFIKKFFDIKFWKFILVGVINTLVGNGLQFVLFALFAWDRYEWGVWLASALGYLIGSIVSYFLNKYFTFKNTEKGWKPILRFALNIAVCYALSYCIVIPVLVFINLKFSSKFQWFWFPMLGWGMGLIFHAFGVFGLGSNWEERKIKEIMNQDAKKQNWK